MWYYEKWQKIWWSFWLKRHIFRWLCGFVIFAHNGTKTWLSEGKFSHNMEKTIKNRYVFVTFAVHHKSTGYGSTNDTIWNRASLCTHIFNCCLIAMFFMIQNIMKNNSDNWKLCVTLGKIHMKLRSLTNSLLGIHTHVFTSVKWHWSIAFTYPYHGKRDFADRQRWDC